MLVVKLRCHRIITPRGRKPMTNDIQKAGLWKRFAAGILDGILLAVLAAGIAFLLGAFLGYDGYTTTWNERCAYYEEQYSTSFQIAVEQCKT